MNERWHRHVVLALVLVAILVAPFAHLGRVAGAQEATPAGAQLATPVPGAQTWHVLVNNVSPDGENWSFNAFYPDHLRAHPGDAIVFTLAPNPNAFHTVMVLIQGPDTHGDVRGLRRRVRPTAGPEPAGPPPKHVLRQPGSAPRRAGVPVKTRAWSRRPANVEFGVSSAVLVNPPPGSDQANTSFTVTLDPALPLGPYFFTSIVDGPTMSGWIDVVAPDQPVQSAGELAAAAQRQYEADLAWLASYDRVTNPPEASNPDSTKTWQVDAGSGSPDNPRLSINEFSLPQKVIHAGDTVTWTNRSPAAVAHTVSGFAPTPDAIPQDLSPYQPGCMTQQRRAATAACRELPPRHLEHLPRRGGEQPHRVQPALGPVRRSATPMASEHPASSSPRSTWTRPIGEGLPFASSYSVTFPNTGTYAYHCAIHPGMEGTVVVVPPPFAG